MATQHTIDDPASTIIAIAARLLICRMKAVNPLTAQTMTSDLAVHQKHCPALRELVALGQEHQTREQWVKTELDLWEQLHNAGTTGRKTRTV